MKDTNTDSTGVTPEKIKQPVNRSCDAPIVGENGKPSRAARRAANRAKRDAATLGEYAAAEIPQSFRKSSGPGIAQVTEPQHALRTSTQSNQLARDQYAEKIGVGALGAGRPSSYTDQEAEAICAWVAEGGSLRSYSRCTGRPMITVYSWMRKNAGFASQYRQAHEDRADSLVDDMLDIVDAAAVNPTIEDVAAAKLRYEARKWIAAKLRPTQWGDKQVVEHVGAVNIRIGIPSKSASVDIIDV